MRAGDGKILIQFPGSSMVEHSAVNRRVAGSSPARGANLTMPCFVYVLLNPEGKTYVGQTSNLSRRLFQHNNADCRLTLHTKRHRGPWRLIHHEEFGTRAAAMRREKELKTGKGREWIRAVLLRGC